MASATQTRPQPRPEVMPPAADREERDREIDGGSAIAALNKSELQVQMEFAERRPRKMQRFVDTVIERSCFNEAIALQMNYTLPRGGKEISGASTRFAEIVAGAWGNCRALSRVVGADAEWVTAQGIYFDCETNYSYGREVGRRITDKNGQRFNADMIGVTGNAASSIAFRNAVLNGIGKGVWWDLYQKTRSAAVGAVETIATQRGEILEWLKQKGVPLANVFNTLGIQGPHDIGAEQLLTLKVMKRDLTEGDKSVEDMFGTAETMDIEAAMTHLNWNEGTKVSSRVAFRGRPGEHLAYLREEIGKRDRAGVTTMPEKKPPQQEVAPKPVSNAAEAAETPSTGEATVGGGSEVAASDGAGTTQQATPAAKPVQSVGAKPGPRAMKW